VVEVLAVEEVREAEEEVDPQLTEVVGELEGQEEEVVVAKLR